MLPYLGAVINAANPGVERPMAVKYTLVDDVDTGPAAAAQDPTQTGGSRFNLDEDKLGPGQALHEEKVDPIAIDFGEPGPTEWFRIDQRPDRTVPVVMAKLTPPGTDRDKLYYVPKSARDIPELKPYLRPYALHVIQKLIGPHTARTAIWPRRLPNISKSGREDRWGATDAVVADRAMKGWVRRETDPNTGAGRRTISPDPREPIPDLPWDDRTLSELLDLALPASDVIADVTA
jgi:hypothetical protein